MQLIFYHWQYHTDSCIRTTCTCFSFSYINFRVPEKVSLVFLAMRNYDLEGPGWKRAHGIDGKQHACTSISGLQRYFDAQINIHELVDASYSKSVPLCHRWCYRKIMVREFFLPVITFESYSLFWCLDLLELFLVPLDLLLPIGCCGTFQNPKRSRHSLGARLFFSNCTMRVGLFLYCLEVSQDLKITVWIIPRFFLSESAAV